MKRPFTRADSGRRFRLNAPDSKFHGRVGTLEDFPLMDPGSAEPHEGVLWFGPKDDRDGWDYVAPKDVEPVRLRLKRRKRCRGSTRA